MRRQAWGQGSSPQQPCSIGQTTSASQPTSDSPRPIQARPAGLLQLAPGPALLVVEEVDDMKQNVPSLSRLLPAM